MIIIQFKYNKSQNIKNTRDLGVYLVQGRRCTAETLSPALIPEALTLDLGSSFSLCNCTHFFFSQKDVKHLHSEIECMH